MGFRSAFTGSLSGVGAPEKRAPGAQRARLWVPNIRGIASLRRPLASQRGPSDGLCAKGLLARFFTKLACEYVGQDHITSGGLTIEEGLLGIVNGCHDVAENIETPMLIGSDSAYTAECAAKRSEAPGHPQACPAPKVNCGFFNHSPGRPNCPEAVSVPAIICEPHTRIRHFLERKLVEGVDLTSKPADGSHQPC